MLVREAIASAERPDHTDDEEQSQGVEGGFIDEIVGAFVEVGEADEGAVCGDGEESCGEEEAEESVKNEEVKGGAFFGSAPHDFALSEDVSEDSPYVIGLPCEFFAFHPVTGLPGNLPNHDRDAGKRENIEYCFWKRSIEIEKFLASGVHVGLFWRMNLIGCAGLIKQA